MRLLIVPRWLQVVFQQNNLAESQLMDTKTLSEYLSKRDMLDYASLPWQMRDYFSTNAGLNVNVEDGAVAEGEPTCSVAWATPCTDAELGLNPLESKLLELTTKKKTEPDMLMLGHRIPEGHVLNFDVRTVSLSDGTDVIGVFPYVGVPCNDVNAHLNLVERLFEAMYGLEQSLTPLRASGLLSRYLLNRA